LQNDRPAHGGLIATDDVIMGFAFTCEYCGKSLSTTEDKVGRRAKCPGCGELLTVPEQPGTVESPRVADEPMAQETACLACGAMIPARTEQCPACGAVVENQRFPGPHIIEFGDVFSATWDRFSKCIGMAVVGNLIASMVWIVALLPAVGVLIAIVLMAEQQHQDPDPLHFLGLIPCLLFAIVVMFFMMPGVAMFYLALGRGENVGIGTLFGGWRFFLKSTVCTIGFAFMVGLGMLAFVVPGIILALRYWPYLYVIVDEDPPGWQCFHRAAELTQGNWGAILLIGVAGMFVNVVAQVVCGVLQLFTQPFNTMLFVTSYLKMSGQTR
jgi:predicted RNA-binding Zn-ribbon protein involved in translation (DUF1610 family)/uncharacterized membrane protein